MSEIGRFAKFEKYYMQLIVNPPSKKQDSTEGYVSGDRT